MPLARATAALPGVLALAPTAARACAVCIGRDQGQGANGGFYWSALLLTALPFAVIAVVGAWVSRAAQRARPRPPREATRLD